MSLCTAALETFEIYFPFLDRKPQKAPITAIVQPAGLRNFCKHLQYLWQCSTMVRELDLQH